VPTMEPVGNTIVPPDPSKGINTFSQLLGLQQQRQALETGQYTQQSAQAKATIDQQSAKENQAGARLIVDPVGNGITDLDGNVLPGAKNKFLQAMPTTGADRYDSFIKAATDHVQYKNAWLKLRQDVRQDVSARMAGTAADPNSGLPELRDTADAIRSDYKGTPAEDDVNKIVDVSKTAMEAAGKSHGIDGAKQAVLNLSRGGIGNAGITGSGGVAAPQATTVDTGGKIQPGTVAPALQGGGFTPGGAPVNKVTAPANMVGPNGQIIQVPAGGAGLPRVGAGAPGAPASNQPRTAADDAPAPNAPRAQQDAYITAVKGANDHVDAVRSADENYGNNKAISNAVRNLSGGAKTGPGTEPWNHVMGVLGTKGADNYQELGAFLDRQAATVRGQMGLPGTNAGAEDAKMIAGNTQYNAKVIQDKNDYTEALTDGLHMYRNGLDRIAGFSGQASPTQVSKFKSAWTNAFDPNVFIGENAYRRSKAEGDRFVASLQPAEAASLAAKRKALQDLAAGKLPQ
jgi:hypothetical protein